MQSSSVNQFHVWRGLALTGLTFNHLLLWPFDNVSFALRLTYQSVGWVSFATVFFVIAGIQWGRRADKEKCLWGWNLKRAGRLFLWVLSATSLFLVLINSEVLNSAPWQRHIAWEQPKTILLAIIGLRLPWLIDVIWLHGWLGIFATVLWSIPFLRVSSGRIAAVSVSVWCLAQVGVFNWEMEISNAPSWHSWTSWQLLFVCAALSQRSDSRSFIDYFHVPKARRMILCVLLFFFIAKNTTFGAAIDASRQASELGPMFAVNSALLCLYTGRLRLPQCLNSFAVFGGRSLFFYSIQCLVVYLFGSGWMIDENEKIRSLLFVAFALLSIMRMNRLVFHRRSA